MSWKRAVEESALEEGAVCVKLGERKIAIFKDGEDVLAIDDTCTHLDAPLSEGKVWGGKIICPWHGVQFNLRTGAASGPPARGGLTTYLCRIEQGEVWVELP